jgi:hypothetical protein
MADRVVGGLMDLQSRDSSEIPKRAGWRQPPEEPLDTAAPQVLTVHRKLQIVNCQLESHP